VKLEKVISGYYLQNSLICEEKIGAEPILIKEIQRDQMDAR